MRSTFQARQSRFHSPVTLVSPCNENCLKPITDLIMPNTGSTVCLRSAYAALPAFVLSRYAIACNGAGSAKVRANAGDDLVC